MGNGRSACTGDQVDHSTTSTANASETRGYRSSASQLFNNFQSLFDAAPVQATGPPSPDAPVEDMLDEKTGVRIRRIAARNGGPVAATGRQDANYGDAEVVAPGSSASTAPFSIKTPVLDQKKQNAEKNSKKRKPSPSTRDNEDNANSATTGDKNGDEISSGKAAKKQKGKQEAGPSAASTAATSSNNSSDQDVRFDRVIFLGTSSAIPVPGKRNMSSMLITTNTGSSMMVDCGEGTQHQLKVCSRAKASSLDMICITHLHGDHCYGLFGLLLTCGTDMRVNPLLIVGPEGIHDLVMSVFKHSGGWAGYYDILFIEIPNEKHKLKEDVDLSKMIATSSNNSIKTRLTAVPLVHGMTCWGYCFQEPDRPGKLDINKAKQLGVPVGPLLGKLKKGEDVTFIPKADKKHPDSTTSEHQMITVKASDCVSETIPGRKVCILQDSSDSSYAVANGSLKNADLFIHEATLEEAMREECIEKGHSTPKMAAEWANDCSAKKLVLTHFSARYNESTSAMLGRTRLGRILNVDNISPATIPGGHGELQTDALCCSTESSPTTDAQDVDQDSCIVIDPADQILAAEAREVFEGEEVIAAKDFLMLDGQNGFKACQELMVKRMPWGRPVVDEENVVNLNSAAANKPKNAGADTAKRK
ncbi:unnamed protein product [Amoebophrya sp. A120]|nr:unnamed protein product [Amoebophrya sp. A120]|eukprot:GSA120T00013770001.1